VSARQRVVHAPRFPLVSPACGTYTGCGGLYALDDAGEYRPEWVTCKRCLWRLGVRPGPVENIADLIGSASDRLTGALRATGPAELTEAERVDLGERLGRTQQLTGSISDALAGLDTDAISDYLREQAGGEG
jgi:hypothetical protein